MSDKAVRILTKAYEGIFIMTSSLTLANEIATHEVVNTFLFPETRLQLGQRDRYCFRDAEVNLRRCGNRYGVDPDASTYIYSVVGDGFIAKLRAVWGNENATAHVKLLEVSPAGMDADRAFNNWLCTVDAEVAA